MRVYLALAPKPVPHLHSLFRRFWEKSCSGSGEFAAQRMMVGFMQMCQNVICVEKVPIVSLDEILAEGKCGMEGADDGLRLISAFFRIRDPELRVAAIDFVSDLAKRSEQSEAKTNVYDAFL